MSDSFKILVPIGFSEQSLTALNQASIFAKATENASITLLSVIEEGGFFSKMFSSSSNTEQIHSEVSKKLKEVAENFQQDHNIPTNTMVAEGVVYEEIARVSSLIDANLVVMGTNGKPQNLRKRFIGSNAYRTAALVKPPVVTIKGVREIDKIETIIFPLLMDRHSKEKVGPTLEYARLFGAKVLVVAVKENDSQLNILRGHVNQVESFIRSHGVECEHQIIENPSRRGVVRNILNHAYDAEGDLVIITEEAGPTDITDYFLGNEMQAVIYHSEIPVMCITPKAVKYDKMWDSF
ncbi:universal stress protein [Croceimicrobium sp.]|uniref:universal stress protein n=1 Tax=Croceimicrobium sp. TaxID=2828340 RepID=UPI003BA89E14